MNQPLVTTKPLPQDNYYLSRYSLCLFFGLSSAAVLFLYITAEERDQEDKGTRNQEETLTARPFSFLYFYRRLLFINLFLTAADKIEKTTKGRRLTPTPTVRIDRWVGLLFVSSCTRRPINRSIFPLTLGLEIAVNITIRLVGGA